METAKKASPEIQECMRHFYLIKPVEGGAFLHELWQVLLPVKFVGLCHGCSQTWGEKDR